MDHKLPYFSIQNVLPLVAVITKVKGKNPIKYPNIPAWEVSVGMAQSLKSPGEEV